MDVSGLAGIYYGCGGEWIAQIPRCDLSRILKINFQNSSGGSRCGPRWVQDDLGELGPQNCLMLYRFFLLRFKMSKLFLSSL